METIETDYLVIGAGATGMAFADTIVEETGARVTIVDRRGRPGGHWNDAYPFVALHQPSAFYGVNSTPLGSGCKDTHGVNAGMYELASGAEITAYYDGVMRRRLLPTGRLCWLPMSDYRGDGLVVSLLSGRETRIAIRRKTVDATYGSPTIPAHHQRAFAIDDGVRVVPPGELTRAWREDARFERIVVLGAGKTAMDTIVWLIESGAHPAAIQWVKPRESWLLDRARTQPGLEFFDEVFGGQAAQMEAFAVGTSVDDVFERLEAAGVVLRVDPSVRPEMFHYATISRAEIGTLRRVSDVVRLGRVRAIERDAIILDGGRVPTVAAAIYVDCTASAVTPRPTQPIFQGDLIVPQLVRVPQPSFSAALVAYVEAHYSDDATKNSLCQPVPFPNELANFPRTNFVNLMNQHAWMKDVSLSEWVRASRLDGFGKVAAAIAPEDHARRAVLRRLRAAGPAALRNLTALSTRS